MPLPPAYAFASAGFRPSGSTCLTPSQRPAPRHLRGGAWVRHKNFMLTSPVLFTTQGSLTFQTPQFRKTPQPLGGLAASF